MSEKKKLELPPQLVMDNILLTIGGFVQRLMVPIFIKNVTASARDKRFYNAPVTFTGFNSLNGTSCGEIMRRTMWDFSIPSHSIDLQWAVREWGDEEIIGLDFSFVVPHTQHWFADIIFRQNQKNYDYIVEHAPFYNESGIRSDRYTDKQYQPRGIMALPKSPDMFVTQLLFGRTLGKYETPKKQKIIGKSKNKVTVTGNISHKENETFAKKINKKRQAKPKTTIVKQRNPKAKLGKTYS